MKTIEISVSDNNFTQKGRTEVQLDEETYTIFNRLVQNIESGLYEEAAAFMEIKGVSDTPVTLTITECK